MEITLIDGLLILLVSAVVVSTVFHRIKIPPIVGYLLVGMIVGPYGLRFIDDSQLTRDIAEFGVVFLLFTIGLEFSLSKLFSLKKIVFGLGFLQVALSILVTSSVGLLLPMTLAEVILVGGVVAMSSTAIVSKQLTDQLELNSSYGISSIGILLFQDLAVIPLLILIPTLMNIGAVSLGINLLWALLKGGLAVVGILLAGRWILRPLFYRIAATYSLELFTLTVLLVTISAGWMTHKLGLSMALGAFIAGMMLGETEFRHQIEADIRPFRDVLLGFFFISIGTQLQLAVVLEAWNWLLLLFSALLLGKVILITLLSLLFGQSRTDALSTGLILAQGGEFGIAILSLGISYQLLPMDYAQVILGALLLSMMVAPILISNHRRIVKGIFKSVLPVSPVEETSTQEEPPGDHVIICGYGRVGQNIARFLEKVDIPYGSMDLDPVRIENATLAGDHVCYGDASQQRVLQSAGLNHARALVISFSSKRLSLKILQQVRQHNRQIPIIVRSYDDEETNELYRFGATEVISELLEASLMFVSHVLLMTGVPKHRVQQLIEESRHHRYDLLRMVFPGQETLALEEHEQTKEGLRSVKLSAGAFAVGKTLQQLSGLNVRVSAIRREQQRIIDPGPEQCLEENDTVVLYGPLQAIEHGESYLLNGGN